MAPLHPLASSSWSGSTTLSEVPTSVSLIESIHGRSDKVNKAWRLRRSVDRVIWCLVFGAAALFKLCWIRERRLFNPLNKHQ